MKKVNFITDLDRTIIHAKNKGFKCVEVMGEREITYMTETSYNRFIDMINKPHVNFIPCTMRNIKQTLRVDFIREYNPKIIICTNGAQIYIDGKLDLQWDNKMKRIVTKEEVEDRIKYLESFKFQVEEIRNIEDFYITMKFSEVSRAEEAYEVLKDRFEEVIKVIQIGVKIFIIHEEIDKIQAVDYIIEKYKLDNVVTAGDSEVDENFTKRGMCILPKHSKFKHPHAIVTKASGIHSTEEIIDILEAYMKKAI